MEKEVTDYANRIGKSMAVAITNSGQLLFLYRKEENQHSFSKEYSLHWNSIDSPWILNFENVQYLFQLPEDIMKQWLDNVTSDLDIRKSAVKCKERLLSNMIVYYKDNKRPAIAMISIDQEELKKIKESIK